LPAAGTHRLNIILGSMVVLAVRCLERIEQLKQELRRLRAARLSFLIMAALPAS